jgi:crossover junction endodeoxyribonuclease RuvC
MKKSILACDPGSRNFGYSILSVDFADIKNPQFELIKPAYIYLQADFIGDRLLTLFSRLCLEVENFCVEEIIFEDAPFQGKFAPDLHGITAVLKMIAAQYQIPIQRLTPTQVKKILTKNGKADKKQVESAVLNFLSNPPMTKFETDHTSDAVGVGIAYFLK